MDVEEICSGWLTKSPSSKYVTLFSRGKISIKVPLKSKWHRRYFVLRKPQGSLPHQFAFDYFKDEHDHRRRGTINLEECEKILSELDSSHYPHLFSIKTKSRHKDRVYYLAAETEEDMLRWVKCLCSLCDLKMGPTSADPPLSPENHNVAPNPPVRHDSMQLTVDLPTQKVSPNQSLANEALSNEILEEIEAINQGRIDIDNRPINDRVPSGYTELVECTTGESPLSGTNGECVQSNATRKPQHLAAPSRSVNQSQSVRRPDRPPMEGIKYSRSANSSPRFARTLPNTRPSTDQLVPPRPPKPGQAPEELYQNLSATSPITTSSNHTSPNFLRINNNNLTGNERFTFTHSPGTSPAVIKRHEAIEGRVSPAPNLVSDSLYHNTAALLSYTNGATNSKQSRKEVESLYDIPKSLNITASIPPPQCSGGVVHKYVNASPGIVSKVKTEQTPSVLSESPSPVSEEVELERHPVMDNHYDACPVDQMDDKPTRPPKPRMLSDPTTLEGMEEFPSHPILQVSKSFRTREYTKDNVFSSEGSSRSNTLQEIKLPSRINTHDSTSSSSSEEEDEDETGDYAVPPAPRPLQQQPVLPERLHHHRTLSHIQAAEHTASTGTVSTVPSHVKRSSSMSKVPAPPSGIAKMPSLSSASPKFVNNQHSTLRSERSSTVCASDWRNKPITTNAMGKQQMMPRQSPRLIERDIQYVELDNSSERTEPSPKPSRISFNNLAQANSQDVLEYTDIDLVKTQALSETRKERDFRKHSDNID
ncbi:GRB2-associated-binding protein 1-like isoform X3 [Watersipora subatra]|uniref:GRB2-associated-binding protein 1-like isoform X3 n=1 Tax=Watersipora subatra TaxID=2589382 RepID=UPI00355B4E04